MAAVLLSSTVHSTPYYTTTTLHQDHLPSAPIPRKQSASPPTRMPSSPKPQPTRQISHQSTANTLITPVTSSQHLDSRNVFATQRPFSSDGTSHTSPSRSDTNLPAYSTTGRSAPLVSPALSNTPIHRSPWSYDDITKYPGVTVHVRDLAHIQDFAEEACRNSYREDGKNLQPPVQYEISAMPIGDIIEMVAGILTKITTTNDAQHKSMHDHIPNAEHGNNLPGLSSSIFAFHGKNVPGITILSYLSRIHKYCPTTYEVFLSLLVYFDRMTERVNPGDDVSKDSHTPMGDASCYQDAPDMSSNSSSMTDVHDQSTPSVEDEASHHINHCFVVDSFNIHRLVIAGVTCASKFFSDVFYTNSRYAKVGGLPLGELNHLELQFLLLNDFRLNIPIHDLEEYGTMLVKFYANEIVKQRETNYNDRTEHELIEAADSD